MLLIGGVGLVKGSVKELNPSLRDVSLELDEKLKTIQWSESAPFETLSLILRYGEERSEIIEIGKINKHKEIEVAVQSSIQELREAQKENKLKDVVSNYAILAINEVSQKYGLPGLSA